MFSHLDSWEVGLIVLLVAMPIALFGAIEMVGRMNREKARKLAQRNKVAELEARRNARDGRR
ncbi:MAG: hypothetical protein K2X73_09955 [Sphingomonas sp.]|uniref:hypothetical protein n=1 Tax=Sphingomonas sp. TaxID=28214 RepID=UPI0025DFEB7D|nr:hypothetical protein [Sphingomonas sp.]MBX9882284.1 hypothetical protein [Sphingomonas sp.]